MTVYRNDKITVDEIRALAPERIVISPGPGFPIDAGVSLELIRELGHSIPLLGVCLGHQAIGEAYGGLVVHAPGADARQDEHDSIMMATPYLGDIPNPFQATRYHSLIVDEATLARLSANHGADGHRRNHGLAP